MLNKLKRIIQKQISVYSDYKIIRNWVKQLDPSSSSNSKHILLFGIISHFWILDIVFYALTLRNKGYHTTLIINRSILTKNNYLVHLLKPLNRYMGVVFFNPNLEYKSSGNEPKSSDNASINNVLYLLKNEQYNPNDTKQKELYKNFKSQYLNTWEFCDKHFVNNNYDTIVIPSGFIYESAAVFDYAKKEKLNIKTVETYGFKTAKRIIGDNEIAVKDFAKFDELEYNDEIKKYISSYKDLQIKPIKNQEVKTGYLAYQKSTGDKIERNLLNILSNENKNILIATTVTGDSSTIGIESPFGVQSIWIKDVLVKYKNTDINIIVRIHPVEKIVKPIFNMAEFIEKLIEKHKITNIHLIKADNVLNTFSFIEKVDLVLTWVSTISADFVLRDKSVVLAAKAPFSKLGFAKYFDSKTNYFEQIERLINSREAITEKNIKMAESYLYFLFKKRVFTISNKNGLGSYSGYHFDSNNHELNRFLNIISE